MGRNLDILGQIFPCDMAAHPLLSLKEGAFGEIINLSLIGDIDRPSFCAIELF